MFTGAATDDVYLWTSLVKQYFVFMCGNAHQEVAFAATLLRGAAHEWYLGYEKRNGNRPPQDWPTLDASHPGTVWFQYPSTRGSRKALDGISGQTFCPRLYLRV